MPPLDPKTKFVTQLKLSALICFQTLSISGYPCNQQSMTGMAGCWPGCHTAHHPPKEKKGKPRAAFPSVVHRSRIYWQRKNTPERNALQTMSTVLRHLLPQERLKDILNYVKIMFLSWIKFTEAYTDFLLGWPMILNSSESRLMFIISWPQCYCGLLIINQIRTSSCSNLI